MLTYDPSLSGKMRNDKTVVRSHGIPVHLKRIPDESRPGRFDPREYELARKNSWTAGVPGGLQELRDAMGFPNRNLNTVEIYTRYEEHNFGGNLVKFWIYYPRKPERKTGRPGFLYLHGGGWIGGTTFTVENPCRLLAERADCVVFNIDYSLAPEKPFPNGLNDCWNSLQYIYEHAGDYGVDRAKLGMGGDSAGGNLTAACALRDLRGKTGMLKYEALIYPAVTFVTQGVDGYEWNESEYEICDEQKELISRGLNLGRPTGNGEETFHRFYLAHGEDPRDPDVSPMFAPSFQGLCKTLIADAEFDGLRMQDEFYGKQLMEAGVETRVVRYKGVGHAFLDKLGVLPQAEDLVNEMAGDVRAM